MPFSTRPHFEDRQIVQYGEDSIQLSGLTKIASTILNYTGATTGETAVTINNITGYLNGQRPYGLKVEPAKVTISGTTGTTTQNVTGFVLKSADPFGSVEWAPISGISFSLSACTSPFYTQIIESCASPTRPIYVSAGRVEFDNGSGSPKTVINTNLGSLGVGTGISPSERLHVSGGDMLIETSNGKFYTDLDATSGPGVRLSGNSSDLIFLGVSDVGVSGTGLGTRGNSEPSFPGYGKQGDGFLYSSEEQNGLNIISKDGTNKDDYIRLYAGKDANGTTPDIHIQGSGTTKGNVGINTITPSEKLHVEGSVRIVDGTEQNGYVLTCDTNGVGSWQASSGGGTFTGNTSASCITDLYVSNVYGCSPITVHDTITYDGSIIDTEATNSFIFGDSHVFTASTGTHGTSFDSNVILGGNTNKITPSQVGRYNSIIGGNTNEIGVKDRVENNIILGSTNSSITNSYGSGGGVSILGGDNNSILGGANSVIIGGQNNTILTGVQRAVILGGQNITANKNDTVLMTSIGTSDSSTMAGVTVNGGNLVIADEMVLSSGVVTTGSVAAPGPTISGKTTWILNLTGANTSALPNANGAGQRLAVYIRAGGGGGNSMTITPATLNGYSTITLTNNGESVDLIYDFTSGWTVIGGNGYTLA